MFVAELRAKRAQEHLRSLRSQVERFQGAHVRYLGVEQGAGGELMMGLTNVDQKRMARLSIKAGEVIYNLRAALDYSIHDLSRDPTTGSGNRWAQFPIDTTVGTFRMRITGRTAKGRPNPMGHFLKGVPPTAVDIIRILQPPAVGNCLWTKDLQDLSNADKHSHLTSLRTSAEVRVNRQEVISFDPDTHKGSLRIYYDAQVDEVAFHDGRAVTDTLEGLCAEVVETVALLKGCMNSG